MQQDTIHNSEWGNAEGEKGVDIRKIMNKAISLWPWMLICALISGTVAFVYLYFATPDYKINAKILVKDEDKKSGGGAMADLSMLKSVGLLSGASNVDNELEIIKSFTLMNRVVYDLQLNVQYQTRKALKTVELYGKNTPFNFQFLSFNQKLLKKGNLIYPVTFGANGELIIQDEKQTYKVKWGDTVALPAGTAVVLPNSEFREKKTE